MRTKVTYQVLFYMFLSQLLTSLGSIVGLPAQQDFSCWWEGIVTNIFTLSAVFYNILLMYLLYTIMFTRKAMTAIRIHHHFICMGIPILSTLLPLINCTYAPPLYPIPSWCFLTSTLSTPNCTDLSLEIYFWLSFYAWVWLGFFVILIILTLVVRYISASDSSRTNITKTIKLVIGYPVILCLTWIMNTVHDFVSYYFPTVDTFVVTNEFYIVGSVLSTLMGFISILFFICTDTNISFMWKLLRSNKFNLKYFHKIYRRKSIQYKQSQKQQVVVSVTTTHRVDVAPTTAISSTESGGISLDSQAKKICLPDL